MEFSSNSDSSSKKIWKGLRGYKQLSNAVNNVGICTWQFRQTEVGPCYTAIQMSTLCRQNAVTPKTLGNFLSCNACQIGHGGGTNMNPLVNDLVQKKTICCVTTHQLSFKQGTKCVQSTSPAPRLFSTFATLGVCPLLRSS
eukprot:scaffold58740_cov13-Tisochrysis_lutea.AAC.1